jgi:hypothetical protein
MSALHLESVGHRPWRGGSALPAPRMGEGCRVAGRTRKKTRSRSLAPAPRSRSALEDPIRLSATGADDAVRRGGPDPALRHRSRRCGPQRRTRSGSPPPEPAIRSAEEDPIRLSATGAGDAVRPSSCQPTPLPTSRSSNSGATWSRGRVAARAGPRGHQGPPLSSPLPARAGPARCSPSTPSSPKQLFLGNFSFFSFCDSGGSTEKTPPDNDDPRGCPGIFCK